MILVSIDVKKHQDQLLPSQNVVVKKEREGARKLVHGLGLSTFRASSPHSETAVAECSEASRPRTLTPSQFHGTAGDGLARSSRR